MIPGPPPQFGDRFGNRRLQKPGRTHAEQNTQEADKPHDPQRLHETFLGEHTGICFQIDNANSFAVVHQILERRRRIGIDIRAKRTRDHFLSPCFDVAIDNSVIEGVDRRGQDRGVLRQVPQR